MIAKHAWKARAASSQTSPLTLQAVALAKGVSLHGFSVKVLPSGIDDPSSGNGVFVADGTVPSGVLVALYAGIWFPSLPMDKVQWGTETQPYSWSHVLDVHGPEAVDPELTSCTRADVVSYHLCCDGGIMDGFRADCRVRSDCIRSPFAVGQLVNHPPKGQVPNVRLRQLEPLDTGLAVSRTHKGLWYLDPHTWSEVHVPPGIRPPTIALQAMRSLLPGQELLLNYNLRRPHPAWYHPVDTVE